MLNGNKIRQIRMEKGLTCLDVANLSKGLNTTVSKSYLEELERGDKINPSFSVIETISLILRIKLDELVMN